MASPSLHIFLITSLLPGLIRGESLSCPAPRSPDNGLSFVFSDGHVVKYSCHPGFTLIGHNQAECQRNRWNHPAPLCRLSVDGGMRRSPVVSGNEISGSVRTLFEWEKSNKLPLINGQWNEVHKRNSSALVLQETNIAAVREQQRRNVSEWRRHRLHEGISDSEWRRQQVLQARSQPETLYARSRAASSSQRQGTSTPSRGDQSKPSRGSSEVVRTVSRPVSEHPNISRRHQTIVSSGTQDGVRTVSRPVSEQDIYRRNQTITSRGTQGTVYRTVSDLQNTSSEADLRLRQISEVHRSRMGPSNGDKAGLVEEARRRQYEHAQTILGPSTHSRRPVFSEEKAYQVETTYRNILGNRRGPVYAVGPPVLSSAPTPPPFTRRPVLTPVTLPTPLESRPRSGEKAAGESLLDQYLRAEHMRRILEMERGGGRRSAIEESRRPAVDIEFLSRLSPELQELYLRELAVSRGKEANDPMAAQQFLQRHGLTPPDSRG